MPTISSLFTPDASKALMLYKNLGKNTPAQVRSTLKVNANLSNQVLFITPGTAGGGATVQVISFPLVTTDNTNQPLIIGIYGNDTDNLAPISIPGDRLFQSTSSLVAKIFADKYQLPVLAADPLNLDAPPGADPDRLHYVFTDPDFTPTIAGIPALFPVPIGIQPPVGWVLDTAVDIPETDFPCEAGRIWIKALAHVFQYHQGSPIHLDAGTFDPADLDPAPFAPFSMAPTVSTAYQMLPPSAEQYGFARAVAREGIEAARGQPQAGEVPPAAEATSEREDSVLKRQAASIQQVVTAVLEANGKNSADNAPQSRSDREATKAVADTKIRYQLMLARIEEITDPNEPEVKILSLVLPVINDVFVKILDTSKLPEATRMIKEQFKSHIQRKSQSRDFHDRSSDFNTSAFDGPLVTALKRAQWADRSLALEPDSAKDQIGLYHFAPPRTGTVEYQERVAAENKSYRQESVGESKTRIHAKAHELNHSGRLESETDLNSTIANFAAIITFISKEAKNSELWKMIQQLHDIWLDVDGRTWIATHVGPHKYIIAAIVLEFQQILAQYVKIANNLEYRIAVQDGKQIDPRAYQEANERARHVIRTMNNVIPGMTLGHLIIESRACSHFYIEDQATKDKRRAERQAQERTLATRPTQRDFTGSRRDETRTSHRNSNSNSYSNSNGNGNSNSNSNNNNNNSNSNSNSNNNRNNAAPELSPEQVAILKGQGVLKYTGPPNSRMPPILDILDLNGSSGLSRICMSFITKDRCCRWGTSCRQKHTRRTGDLTGPNNLKLTAFVNHSPHL